MPSHVVPEPIGLVSALVKFGLAESNNKARNLIQSGAVRLDGNQVTDPKFQLPVPASGGLVLSVGRRQFLRLLPPYPARVS
jgi:tyrosyl-tRNA synthetase